MFHHRLSVAAFVLPALAAVILSGCAESRTARPLPPVPSSPQNVVTYPEGRWELHGRGTSDSPQYWAWIPTGANPPAPPSPPGLPFLALQRVVKYSDGQWDLRGQGTKGAPYFWVWAPAGANAPPRVASSGPPPMSTAPGRVVTRPDGRWELYGQGTPDSPYYWAWVPTGTASPGPPPPLPNAVLR